MATSLAGEDGADGTDRETPVIVTDAFQRESLCH